MKEFRDIFNPARVRRDLTIMEIARRLGISDSALESAIADPKNLTIDGLARLLDAVGARVEIRELVDPK